jgi:hypothetical protein
MYAECLQACSAAVSAAAGAAVVSGSCGWVPELLIAVVPAAVDAHLAEVGKKHHHTDDVHSISPATPCTC